MNNLHMAKSEELPQRYNINNVISMALQQRNTLHLNNIKINSWYNRLHPTSKNLLMAACIKHNIKIVH